MKHLFSQAKDTFGKSPNSIVASFFFNARGDELEKSTTGCYRSLFNFNFSTLFPGLQDILDSLGSNAINVIRRNGWQHEPLKHILALAAQRLTHMSIFLFVDALDECDEDEVADMISFFEELCGRAFEKDARIHILFFPVAITPNIVIRYGYEIVLENEPDHNEDIERYIATKLRLGQL